jgi:O-acetyl-ADP-ribose deacetylase (regulator of RNase III)
VDPDWWRAFNDPALTQLIDESLRNNADLSLAAARIAEARAVLRLRDAERYPLLSGQANGARQQASEETAVPGGGAIYNECKAIVAQRGSLSPGQAVKTTGGNLPARYVIHTVGPVWHGGGAGEAATLASAYRESLRVAESYGMRTIAFPSIATGAYRYPLADAAEVALAEVVRFLREEARSVAEVTFVLFDGATLAAYASALEAIADRQ